MANISRASSPLPAAPARGQHAALPQLPLRRRAPAPCAPRHVARYHPDGGGAAGQQQQAPPLLGEEQSFAMAFGVLDKDGDGMITQAEAWRLLAFVNATQRPRPSSSTPSTTAPSAAVAAPPSAAASSSDATAAASPPPAPHWDQHLARGVADARRSGGVLRALRGFLAGKLSGKLQRRPPRASDLVWSTLGMGAAMGAIALIAARAAGLPLVGPLHQQGLPLMLGSFGTMAVLLFGRPDAEPVRLWPIIGGQLVATVIAVAAVKALGTSALARAAAMGLTIAAMMHIDAVHPPGGALVLLAMDNKAVQALEWGFLLWPSLLLTICVALPIAAATNVLKRRVQFDWPAGPAAPKAAAQAASAAVLADLATVAPQAVWGPTEAERWRASVLAPPGAEPGLGKRR